jgi:hypothetical protein
MTITTRAIYQVVPQEKERFELALADRRNPAFPALAKSNGITEISVKEVECERAAAYKIVGYANELGNILVAVCESGFRVRDLAIGARAVVDAVLKMPPNKEGESPKIEFYSQDTLENGSELYYLGSAAILFNKVTDRAVVVAVSTRMCNFGDWYNSSPLCTDIKGALKKITVAVEQSLGSR